MTTVRPEPDKRFHRAHVQPFGRRSRSLTGRALRLLLAVALLGGGAWQGAKLLVGAGVLQIDEVVVDGNRNLSRGEVLALLEPLRGANILTVDLEEYQELVLDSGWVQSAALRRLLPATIEVTITERVPIGLVRFATQLYLVDATGTVVDEYRPQFAALRLPVIDGLQLRDNRGSAFDRTRAALAARLTTALAARPDLAGAVSQVDVSDASDAVVLLSGDSTLLHLGHERFVERIDRYLDLAQTLRASVPDIDAVDLRYDKRVYVRPADEVSAG